MNMNPMILMMVMMKTLHGFASGDDHDHKNYSNSAAGAFKFAEARVYKIVFSYSNFKYVCIHH